MDTDEDRQMFEQERHVCHLAVDVVRATQAYVRARKSGADLENSAATFERSFLSLVEEVYAVEFERLYQDRAMEDSRDIDSASPAGAIHALAAEFVASLVQEPGDQDEAGELPVRTSVLLGSEFSALSDALHVAGYLEPAAPCRLVPA